MKKIILFSLIAAMLVFTSCSSVAHIEKDESINFDNYKTFSWIVNEKDGSKQLLNDIQASNLQNAVSSELIKANWQESKTMPDVILKHDVLVENKIRLTKDPVYSQPFTSMVYNPYSRRWINIYYPSRFLGYEENQYQAHEGKITITMIDAKTDKVIWQGWTTEDIDNNLTSKDIKAGVKSIFKKFEENKK